LGRDVDRVDLGVRLTPPETAPDGFARSGTAASAALDRWPSWIHRFTTDPVRFCRIVSTVFLEYDADCSLRSPTPSIFLGLGERGILDKRRHRPAACSDLKPLLLDLMGSGRMATCEETLAVCFEELPRGAQILVAGAMLGRSPQSARVSVSIPRQRIGEYLRRLGVPDCGRKVSSVARQLGSHSAAALIDFDVGIGIGPKVGVHFSTARENDTRRLLDQLAAWGLCTVAKRRAVLAWPRIVTVRLWKRGWPCRLHCYLNHIKVACDDSGLREAKIYLGVAPRLSLIG
jgi:hypothetical protein